MLYGGAVKVGELFDRLHELGWIEARVRGSHHVFTHPRGLRPLPVPVHGKDIPDSVAKAILRQAARATKEA
jgi:predicted RNA binding protein YcfA (HicA-like mRNA interferase family)